MKVCHITSAHMRYDDRIYLKECQSLVRAGFDVTLIVNDNMADEIKEGIKIVSTHSEKKGRFHRLTQLKKIFKLALNTDADIYHLQDPELLLIAKKLKKKNKKVIFDSHENYTLQIKEKPYLPAGIRACVSRLYSQYEKHVLRKIDAAIIPCTFEGKNPFEHKCKKVVFINGYPLMNEFYDHYEPHNRSNTLCYVGGLTHQRGISSLIDAAGVFKKKVILAGQFSSEEYQKEMEQKPGYQYVDYRGFVNREQVREIYQEAAVGVSTLLDSGQYTKMDNLPTKVYEYLSMGLPVVVTDYPYAREVLKKYPFGIAVKPDDAECISNAVAAILEDENKYRSMAEQGRKAVSEVFNWENEERKLIQLYKEL